jgi:DNA-binding transcriptional LysR family regulator
MRDAIPRETPMEMMQLEMFVAVVEEGSVGRAARRVHRTQPAVTLGVGKLEAEFGGPVLDRSSRVQGYRPTPLGEIVYEYASRILGLRNELSGIVKEGEGCAGELRIGSSGTESLARTTGLVGSFTAQHPEVRVQVLSDVAENVLRELVNRKLDVVLLPALPARAQANTDLVASQFTAGPRGARFWAVERRVGRSHVAKLFAEMLRTSHSGEAPTHGRSQARRIARRTGIAARALRPAK